MELVRGTYSKAEKFETQEDIISRMPDNVITNIMDHLPIQDAVRTSILSTKWRFKWTMLTQLTFDIGYYLCTQRAARNTEYFGRVTSRILLNLKGAITKFSVSIFTESCFEDVNHWVLFLSGKGIKELTLQNLCQTPLKLSTYLFSCLDLKHLELHNCIFPPIRSFHRFPNLLYLEFFASIFESDKFGEFLSWCPLLETLKFGNLNLTSKMKQIEFGKNENIKVLYVRLCPVYNMEMITTSSIFQLIDLLPKLQKLTLDFLSCKILADYQMKVATTIPCLKTLVLKGIDFRSGNMVSCAIELICACPNLQTLKIKAKYDDVVLPFVLCSSKVTQMGDYSSRALPSSEVHPMIAGQLQLQKVVFEDFRGSENELCLIEAILCCSPLLKKMDAVFNSPQVCSSVNVNLEMASKLLKLQHAYPKVEIALR